MTPDQRSEHINGPETMACEATPRPWRIEDRRHAPLKNVRIMGVGNHDVAEISDVHQRDEVCGTYRHERDKAFADAIDAKGLANAALIVTAVNAHDALVALLNAVRDARVNSITKRDMDNGAVREELYKVHKCALLAQAALNQAHGVTP